MAAKKIAGIGETYTNDPKTGRPFESRETAAKFITDNELDGAQYVAAPNPQGSGFVVMDLVKFAEQQRPDATSKRQKAVNPLRVGPYWKVTFQAKRDDNDTEDVFIGVDGVQRYYPREEPVIISNAFLLAVQEAKMTKWTHEPGKGRQFGKPSLRYPINERSTATEEEFLQFEREFAQRKKQGARGQTVPQRAA